MELRENIDSLLSSVTVSEEMHRAIMEGQPGKKSSGASQQNICESRQVSRQMAGTAIGDRGNRGTKRLRKSVWRKAAMPVAAAVLIMSTMYVGAGYLINHMPLRDIFASRDNDVLTVPEAQQRPDIYGEILDDSFSSEERRTGTEASDSMAGENVFPRGNYGEIVMDNEWFSIEMLEMTCAGRELTASYILTWKTEEELMVRVSIDNDYYGQWKDGLFGEEYDVSKTLMQSGFGNRFRWNKLPEGCDYELAENQELCIITQLGKTDYLSGTYTLYAEADLYEAPVTEGGEEPFQMVEIPDEDIQRGFYRTSIEIICSGDYGLALNGAIDKTEEQVHFDQYEVYVSPFTVYLTLDGTYEGEVSAIWGMRRSHDITISFVDGTETQAKVLLSGMGYGKGEIDVEMRASFETAVDPESIVKVMLDDIVILEQ